jgi:NAD+ synthase
MPNISLAQINPTVGDIDANVALILDHWKKAAGQGADLVVFPEMCITAYPVEDLVLREAFRKASMKAVEELANKGGNLSCDAIIGGLCEVEGKPTNSLFLLSGGEIQYRQDKVALPNYGVFDEKRHFHAGEKASLLLWKGLKLGLFVCEDMWDEVVATHIAGQQPDCYISINGSPFETRKFERRYETARRAQLIHPAPLFYVNQIGGQDDLVFDGSSFVLNAKGEKALQLAHFAEDSRALDFKPGQEFAKLADYHPPSQEALFYQAAVLGVRDYVHKSGFREVGIALSGGIDSALTLAIAVDAIGSDQVHAVYMPSPYNAESSATDAEESARLLGVDYHILPIEPAMGVMEKSLEPFFKGKPANVAEENIQSRLRGNFMMALSNKMGWLVLTTGNKSEMAVGYATLYGDMCGAYNPLVDIYKTMVFRLAEWRNANIPQGSASNAIPVMPQNVISKPPSAELRPDQKDEDSLPPYDVLDPILQMLIENELSMAEIVAQGYEEETVRKVATLLYNAEYKRRQAAPGVKVSSMAFGSDRRYPIVNRFRS